MTIKTLDTIAFPTLMDCFFSAFENYFVKMPHDVDYFKKRFTAAKVRYDLSYGMFDNERPVGFIINGIDDRNGDKIAFNTGTGVIPGYRGQKIVQKLYDHALPILKANGITKCQLEVITKNHIAIKAYENIGFKIYRTLKCFIGDIVLHTSETPGLKKIEHSDLDWENIEGQEYYSWDHHQNSVREGDYDYYQVIVSGGVESYFIINSANGALAQFENFKDTVESWNRLFSGIKSISSTIKINNVDERLTSKLSYLESIGIENTIDQFEMEFQLQ